MTFDPFADPAQDVEAPVLYGPLEAAVRGDVDALGLVSPTARSLAELAFNMARKLDSGAGMATAAVAKELRDTLNQMAEEAGNDDGSALLERLSAPVRDPARP